MTAAFPIIAPSILSANFACLGREVEDVVQGGADWIHFDVMDNHYVPNLTVGPLVLKAIRPYASVPIDVHLMVDHPERMMQSFIDAGAGIITIHSESTEHAWRAMMMARDAGVESGIAINPGTPVSFIEPLLDIADYVLVMTVNPGWGGQSFIQECMKKVEELSLRRDSDGYGYLIEVDGGVSMANIRELFQKGVDVAVTGSSFFRESDKGAFLERMRREAEGLS